MVVSDVVVEKIPARSSADSVINDFSIQVATVNGSGSQTANVEPMVEDFLTSLNLVDEPLALLGEENVRPPKSALDEIMKSFG